jgi:anti-anti-sigma regulatory factor
MTRYGGLEIKVDFVDSSGVRAVIEAVRDAQAEGRGLALAAQLAPAVERLSRVLKITRLLPAS